MYDLFEMHDDIIYPVFGCGCNRASRLTMTVCLLQFSVRLTTVIRWETRQAGSRSCIPLHLPFTLKVLERDVRQLTCVLSIGGIHTI